MNKEYIIYEHINKINGKRYIGQTCQKPEYRWNHGEGYKNSAHFYSAIKKYGWDNFEHNILYTNLTQKEANKLEEELIKKYNLTNREKGYNSDSGGKNKIPSDETRLKQSISAQNRPIVSEETKKKLSQLSKGITRSKETRDKISQASIQREKDKQARGGRRERKVKCLNTGEVFNSCREAADWCGLVGTSGIASVCNQGKQKTAGVHPTTKEKLKWGYVDSNE